MASVSHFLSLFEREGDGFDTESEQAHNDLKTGKHFANFFSSVTQGNFGKSNVPYKPLLNNAHARRFEDTLASHTGHFDDHIAKSIPTFKDVQVRKGHAIVEAFGKSSVSMLDIGGSEGSFAKTITVLSNGNIQTTVLDPNAEMRQAFDRNPVRNSRFDQRAFYRGWREDDGREVPAMNAANSKERFDIIHESMTFQFVSNERDIHFSEAKRLLRPNGLFLAEEKVRTPEWAANEAYKDKHHKNLYFTDAELAAKDQRVGFQQSKAETKAVGMVDNMVHRDHLEMLLCQMFRYVYQYWDSGNFKGYAASDDEHRVTAYIQALGDLNSQFSTVKLPRRVMPNQSSQPQPQKPQVPQESKEPQEIPDEAKAVAPTVKKPYRRLPFHMDHVRLHM